MRNLFSGGFKDNPHLAFGFLTGILRVAKESIFSGWDIRQEFGKGYAKVQAKYDGIPYDGRIVNMGVKNPDCSICYVIGVLKAIRTELDKHESDTIHVLIEGE